MLNNTGPKNVRFFVAVFELELSSFVFFMVVRSVTRGKLFSRIFFTLLFETGLRVV